MQLPVEVKAMVSRHNMKTLTQLTVDRGIAIPNETSIRVESGVALPGNERKAVYRGKYPFGDMRPPRPNGDMDSFAIDYDESKSEHANKQKISSALYAYRKAHPKFKASFAIRRIGDKLRCWRTK